MERKNGQGPVNKITYRNPENLAVGEIVGGALDASIPLAQGITGLLNRRPIRTYDAVQQTKGSVFVYHRIGD